MSEKKYERSGREILPTNKVVTVVPTEAEKQVLVEAIKAAGFADENIMFHHGESGKEYVDLEGSRLGFFGQFIRQYQRLAGPEARLLEMAEKGLEAGHYLVGVQTNGRKEQWQQVADIMKAHTKKPIFFCGRATIQIIQL